jgi:hypothetical protein
MKIKKFNQIFENNSITNIEVKNIISDVLVELNDIGNFSWHVSIEEDKLPFKSCNLIIKYFGDGFTVDGIFNQWVEILERAFYLLNEEDIRIYDQKQSNIEVKPGKMNLSWTVQTRRNPMNFSVESVWWQKDFYLKK